MQISKGSLTNGIRRNTFQYFSLVVRAVTLLFKPCRSDVRVVIRWRRRPPALYLRPAQMHGAIRILQQCDWCITRIINQYALSWQ